jgi:hypothetical protein
LGAALQNLANLRAGEPEAIATPYPSCPGADRGNQACILPLYGPVSLTGRIDGAIDALRAKARRARQAFACCASGVLSARAEGYARRRLRKAFSRHDGTWVNLEQRLRVPNFDGTIQTLDRDVAASQFP